MCIKHGNVSIAIQAAEPVGQRKAQNKRQQLLPFGWLAAKKATKPSNEPISISPKTVMNDECYCRHERRAPGRPHFNSSLEFKNVSHLKWHTMRRIYTSSTHCAHACSEWKKLETASAEPKTIRLVCFITFGWSRSQRLRHGAQRKTGGIFTVSQCPSALRAE